MKRSRACDDLRALESSAANNTSSFWGDELDSDAAAAIDSMAALSVSTNSTGQLFQHRVKRSKRVDMVVDNDFCDAVSFCALEFAVDSPAATTRPHCSVLPSIRRTARDVLPVECDTVRSALQFKKKLQLAGVNEPLVLGDAVDEAEMLLCGRFQLDARCLDPLSTHHQASPFDLSSLIMLSNR